MAGSSKILFRRNIGKDMGEVSLRSDMLKVLIQLDTPKTASALMQSTGMKGSALKATLVDLIKMGLIERIEETGPPLEAEFIEFVKAQLADVLGPMAKILIEDSIRGLGETLDHFPKSRAAELVEVIGNKIPNEKKRREFISAVLVRLRNL